MTRRTTLDHLQLGAIALGCALAAALTIPTPWGRIVATVLTVAALVVLAVAPRDR